MLGFSPSFFMSEEMEDSKKLKMFLFQGEVEDQEHLEHVLNKLLDTSNEKLLTLCTNPDFYNDEYKKIRKFLNLNFDLKTPLGTENKEEQAYALCQAVAMDDKDILKLLLKLGVSPNSEYEDKTALEHAKGHEECIKILTEALQKTEAPGSTPINP
jgi:hypothetical protein